ncbi:MAG: GNAT family N-acetyltransferase [Sulfurimonadaceae bacterium]|jgi:hypothetical protein|nr:GNAT family N-acetyltransferase [Sulfurimonadaceae bacterium]
MQIRALDLKELYEIYEIVKELYPLRYEEFEDLVYEMRETYKMFGVFERETLVAFAGCVVQITLKQGRHLYVNDFGIKKGFDKRKYTKLLKEFLEDCAKTFMCENVLYGMEH